MKTRPKALCLVIWTLTAAAAQANCNPPFKTLLSCNIYRSEVRIEFCHHEVERPDGTWNERISYNMTDGLGPSELYFETDQIVGSTKYWHLVPSDSEPRTDGLGATRGNYVYAAFVTGHQGTDARAAQIHVYDSVDAFENAQGEVEIERLYCDPDTILVDSARFTPG